MTTTNVISNQYKQKFEFLNFQNGRVFDFSVLLICCLSLGFSLIESILNHDSFHMYMYVEALDIKRGLIPYKETFIYYGILTSWIHTLSLSLFGERLMSMYIATGIFYSFSLFLSYQIFLKFLPKYTAFFCTFLIFLLHPYIILSWPNYYSYTFFLLSIVFFINKKNDLNAFLSGLFVGLSLLCRYSSIQAILPPFILFFVYQILFQRNTEKTTLSRILFFSLGLIFPLLLFFLFLFSNSILDDFWIQNKIVAESWTFGVTISNFLPKLLISLITFGKKTRDSRIIFFTIIFFWNLAALFYFLRKLFLKKDITQEEALVMACSLVTLFGYLNALHIYDLFRLINGSSLGIGVILYTVGQTSRRIGRKIKIIILLPFISLCFIWANSLIFFPSATSSIYFPWKLDTLMGKGVSPTDISIFRGKILSQKYYEFYQEIFQIISKFDQSYYIVNYSQDVVAMLINDLPRVQISSVYISSDVEQAYPEEANKIQQIINTKKAVIISDNDFSDKDLHIPGYKVVFSKSWVSADVAWAHVMPLTIYISVPEEAEI
ncbi:ArnT family glycosyltransferase [Nostoc sp.]|uniref:ArnT family glycosyltransferase n=1 Tax=Nostoc sp. TaxID=1180 RepID=UPI002FFB7049